MILIELCPLNDEAINRKLVYLQKEKGYKVVKMMIDTRKGMDGERERNLMWIVYQTKAVFSNYQSLKNYIDMRENEMKGLKKQENV